MLCHPFEKTKNSKIYFTFLISFLCEYRMPVRLWPGVGPDPVDCLVNRGKPESGPRYDPV